MMSGSFGINSVAELVLFLRKVSQVLARTVWQVWPSHCYLCEWRGRFKEWSHIGCKGHNPWFHRLFRDRVGSWGAQTKAMMRRDEVIYVSGLFAIPQQSLAFLFCHVCPSNDSKYTACSLRVSYERGLRCWSGTCPKSFQLQLTWPGRGSLSLRRRLWRTASWCF